MEKKLPSRIRRKRNIKIKKSTIGMFAMVFAFVFAMFHVFAGENNKIIVETKTANRGDTVNLKVNLECKQEYNSALIELEFDTDVLEYVRTTMATTANPAAVNDDPDNVDPINFIAPAPNKAEDVAAANESGKLSLGYAIDGEVACEDIQMASVRFKVKDNAPYGSSPVTISTAKMAKEVDGEKTNLTVDKENGAVNLSLPVDLNSVALEEDTFTIQKGETDNIVVTYEPENTTDDKTVTYTGYDEDVITVDSDGTIHAVATGTTTVTVTAFGKTMTANVTVVNEVQTVTLSGSTHEIEAEEELQLTAAITPNDADDKTLTWSSSSSSVATVDQNGKVTGVATGTTTIKATSVNGKIGTYEVNVIVPITAFTLTSNANLELNKNATSTITYTITPNEPSESTTVTWTSSDESVATVSNGVITAMGGGTATITGSLGTTKNNIRPITVNVTVNVPLTSVTITEDNFSLLPTQEKDLHATLDPSDATNKDVTWTSNNTQVATVDANGKVTAVAPGDAVITARVAAEDKEDTVNVHVKQPVTGATINKSEVTLARGDEDTLSVTFTPANAEEEVTVTWSSADSSSVSVDTNGKIKAIKGTQSPVRITGTLSNGMDPVTCDVTVNVPLNDISLDKTTLTLDKNNSEKVTVIYDPSDTSDDKTVRWESSNESIATVDSQGNVTGTGRGVTTITATVGTHSKSCQVTVNVPVTSVTITDEDFTLARSKTKSLTATVAPDDANPEYKTVTWSSDNESVATVDSNGVVTAVAKGTANITATANGKSDSVKVTVNVPVTGFTTPEDSKTIIKNQSATISTTIEPSDADDKTITWTSSNSRVATVDANGKVTGVAAGTAKITGTLSNDMKVEVNVTVEIIPVTAIEIGDYEEEMLKDGTQDGTQVLTVTYSPENATEVTDVTWESSNTQVATVDANGTVTGIAAGTVTITARMGQLSDSVDITVIEVPLEGISLDANPTETEVGKPYQIVPKLEPLNATDDIDYTYESSDPEIATVDQDGKVTTKKAGKVTITIKASNGTDEFEDTIELTVNTPSSPQTGVTPIWVYGGIIAVLLIIGVVIYKKKELF